MPEDVKGVGSSRVGIIGSCEAALDRCLDSNPHPLQEQYILLTVGPSPVPPR